MKQKIFFLITLLVSVWMVFPSYGDKEGATKFLYQAHQLFQKKKYDEAIFHFKKALDADPNDATLYYNIGVVYQIKGKAFYGHAKTWYEKAIEKDKKLAFALYNLGIIAYSERKFDEARKLLESARVLKPQDAAIQEALREIKKTMALQKSLDEKVQKKQEETPVLSETKTETQPLTETPPPSVTEPKKENTTLTKTQKSTSPEVKTENKKVSSPAKEKKTTPMKPAAKTQKTVKPDVKITETKHKPEVSEKKQEEGKNIKTVVCADVKNRTPVSSKETFSPSDKQVVVWLELKNKQGNHVLESKWYGPDGKLYSIGTQNVQIAGPRYRTWLSRKLAGTPMGGKKGMWRVEILIDKAPVKHVNFSVQ